MDIIKSVNIILDAVGHQEAIVNKIGGEAGVVLAKQGLDITNSVINFVMTLKEHIDRTNERAAYEQIKLKLKSAIDIADKATASAQAGDWDAYESLYPRARSCRPGST
ncbi:hypothetical protein [Borrelia sp. P9F1]|uniref:hypothetical protein n=1 Tax=Borrelia sp. P9F1 TaxID=3058374 RepID=UPI0026489273|nr:hypothetical protein [Borrelia sp. P9F1]WKC58520.1 hypothetical protein QYZ68_04695 [Borrelia sp. P9F1]